MSRAHAWLILVVPALVLPCCARFGAIDEDTPSTTGADASNRDGNTSTDGPGPGDGSTLDAPSSSDATTTDASDAAGPCDPACKGAAPCGVKITTNARTYCIDPTEVTVAQYKKFLATEQGKSVELPAPCGVTSIVARAYRPDDQPVTNVTFCDAAAYCKWAGKRLCGTTDGKALAQADYMTQNAAWYHACTHGTAGHNLIGGVPCRLGTAAPLASGTTCQGGYPGLFDMPGNVWEWVDYTTGGNAFFIGNGFSSPSTGDTCATVSNTTVKNPLPDVGFRCCSY